MNYVQNITDIDDKIIAKAQKEGKSEKEISDFYLTLDLLGFKFDLTTYDPEVKLLIKKWQKLRNEGDYIKVDKVRKQLQELDVI